MAPPGEDTERNAKRRVALVIGNGAYNCASPLANPRNDAEAMAAVLARLGFDARSGLDLGRDAMEDLLVEFEASIKGAHAALLFYAGHGLQVKGQNYLIPVDADLRQEMHLKRRAFSLDDILEIMAPRARNSLIFLDACRDNPFARSLRAGAPEVEQKRYAIRSGLAEVKVTGGSFIAFATAPNNVAYDGTGGNSPFTEALVSHIETPDVSVGDMMISVRLQVLKATQGRQEPWDQSALRERFCFNPSPPPQKPEPGPVVAPPPQKPEPESVAAPPPQKPGRPWPLKLVGAVVFLVLAIGVWPQRSGSEQHVIKTIVNETVLIKQESNFKPGDTFKDCTYCPEMTVVPAGRFRMGSPADEPGRLDEEGPQHEVMIANAFAVGQFAVTFAEWDACVDDGGCGGYRPSDEGWGRGDMPVINVSWDDAQVYVKWLSSKTGKRYRLLSEAEREYVARAGTTTPFWWGKSITSKQANYNGNYTYADKKGEYRQKTVPVKSFEPNRWGLYQVHGNVLEWTEDCWNKNYEGAPKDGSAWTAGHCFSRVLRGGSWDSHPWYLRAAFHHGDRPDGRFKMIGIRVARTFTS